MLDFYLTLLAFFAAYAAMAWLADKLPHDLTNRWSHRIWRD